MADNTKVGQNYTTPDLVAKVTGKAKYAEDFRVDGMLYAKLLLSPLPHARVRSVDTSAAEAMPGVRAILRASELPAPADVVTDLGERIPANPKGERALSDEPVYAGEPVLAVAAVDEETAAAAIEAIEIDFEPLPFVVDPLVTLRSGEPNARTDGNCWGRQEPAGPLDVQELKWTEADFAEYDEGRLPTGPHQDEWSFGDVKAGFERADLLLDETFSTPNNQHHVLEPRSALAYWRNGKLYMHTGTQSAVQTVASIARWMRLDMEDVVLISEYTGGGFGSRATGAVICTIPAVLAKKAGAPVMLRITRQEEQYIGGLRPAIHGRIKAGFTRDGRLTALDMFCVGENSAYEPRSDTTFAGRIVSLLYQPPAMRVRAVSVLTNTPPRRAQSQPGGFQGIMLVEPVIAKAARQLGIDQVEIRRINAPAGKAPYGPPEANGELPHCTSAFVREALDRGAELFDWETRKARSGQRRGSTVRGAGVAVSSFVAGSTGFDGLFVIEPDGKMYIKSGVGNLGTASFTDVHRVAAEMMGMPWDKVEIAWGNTSRHLPWTCVSGGSQTTHSMTRAAHAAASDAIAKAKEIAARTLGGSPESYRVADERVSNGNRSMTLASVARRAIELGGKYDGHELPENINEFTTRSATALAGRGLMGVARDTYGRDGSSFSFVAGFAEVEVDVETGAYRVIDYAAVGDSGTIIHPRSLRWTAPRTVCARHGTHARAEDRLRPEVRPVPCDADVPKPAAHDSGRAAKHEVGRREPAGSRDARRRSRHRRATGGRRSVRGAERIVRRARRRRLPPRTRDPRQYPHGARTWAAHAGAVDGPHLRKGTMAIVNDVIPPFRLFQPTSLDEAAELVEDLGDEAWVMAGGMDSFDWLKDRTKRTGAIIELSQVAELRGIRETDNGLEIGAATTLTDVAEHPAVVDRFGLLAKAAGLVASPQIRNQGTIGGNVSQDTRCVYYRDGWTCYRAGGNICYADTPTAVNREHAILDASRCVAVNPSDTAPALVALDAQMVIQRGRHERVVDADDYFIGPDVDIRRMTVLEPGDLLTAIRIPATWAGSRFYFEKVRDRQVWDFPLVNVASAVRESGGLIEEARVVVGAVAARPLRLREVEQAIAGQLVSSQTLARVGELAIRGARPLRFNAYKVPLMRSLVQRAVRGGPIADTV